MGLKVRALPYLNYGLNNVLEKASLILVKLGGNTKEAVTPSISQPKVFHTPVSELSSALKPRQPSPCPSPKSPGMTPPSSTYQPQQQHAEPSHIATVAPTPIGPGSKPGTVKAIVSQRYNNPIGLYSNENASTQYEGQTKFLMDKDDMSG